jgi:nitroreductase
MSNFYELAKARYSVRNYLDVPVEDEKLIEPIAYLPLGYPGKEPDDRNRHLVRKDPGEFIHWDKF